MKTLASAVAAVLLAVPGATSAAPPQFSIALQPVAQYAGSGAGNGLTGVEIVAYDRTTQRVFAVNTGNNTVDVVDLRSPATPVRIASLDFAAYGGGVNGVAVRDGLVAVAAEARTKTDPGTIVFVDAASLAVVGQVTVGALPDMVTFTPDGDYVLVANEGEPNEDYSVDPEGSVSVIDLRNGVASATVRTADFSAYVGQEDALRARGVRIYGVLKSGAASTAAQDFEPEYIAVQGPRAYVTLQENNAVAVLNVGQAKIEAVLPLGFKDHGRVAAGQPVNPLDASDRDSAINVKEWPVFGMFQPDAIATLKVRGEVFLLTANEGDARVYPTADGIVPGVLEGGLFNEEIRVGSGSYPLSPAIFPNASTLKQNANLGRLTVTKFMGRNATTGNYERIYAFGARSFAVWDAAAFAAAAPATAPNAGLVWDSAAQLEQLVASRLPKVFNASNTNNTFDDRSDNKGPEPEGIAVGRVGPRDYAFIGLERIGGIAVYDVSNPRAPAFVQYVNPRSFVTAGRDPSNASGPEGIEFVAAGDSPNGRPLLLVGNEASQTMTVYEIEQTRVKAAK